MTFTAQIWVVVLIGRAAREFASTNQKHYQDLVSDRHQYGISAVVAQTSLCGKTSAFVAKYRLFLQAILFVICFYYIFSP